MNTAATLPDAAATSRRDERTGVLLVFLSALCWSFGGALARYIGVDDSWTIVFWRSVWAAVFLVGFMIWRDGLRGTVGLFAGMGLPGLLVATCFAIASSSFVVALSYTTVANILLIQTGAPLMAALLAFCLFGERVMPATWVAIACVIVGVLVMVSESLTGAVSPVGDGLALLIAFVLAVATVLTRRFAHVRMTPATCLGVVIAGCFAASRASGFAVPASDMVILVAFGAFNLGLGLAFFASGARLIPAALAALIGTLEPVFGPIWVWLAHGEVPSVRTLVGGAIVFAALFGHLLMEFRRQTRPARPGVAGFPAPH